MLQTAKSRCPDMNLCTFGKTDIWEESDQNSVFRPIRYFILKVMMQCTRETFPRGPTDMNWGSKRQRGKKGSFLSQDNSP